MFSRIRRILNFLSRGEAALNALTEVELLRLWSEEMARPRYAATKRLQRHGFKVYSQSDEDGIIQEIFHRIGARHRTFVEFGAATGAENNTVKLLVEGWSGVWLEASDRAVVEIRKAFGDVIAAGRLVLTQAIVDADNINGLLEQSGMHDEVDLLSIDIDYNDYWVWRAIEVVRPRVVVIEYNASLRPPLSLAVPYDAGRTWDGSNYFGASLEALVRLGQTKGYRVVGCNFSGSNAFFVREDLCGAHFHEPATAEEHYEPPRYVFTRLTAGHRPRPGPYVTV